jgi:hypothetical protein
MKSTEKDTLPSDLPKAAYFFITKKEITALTRK